MNPPTQFNSVHDYLDECFEGKSPNHEELQNAKAIYWRAYNTDLKRRLRKNKKTITMSLSKEEYQLLMARKPKSLKLYQFARMLLLQTSEINNLTSLPIDTAVIEQQLFAIAEYLEDLLECPSIDTSQVEILEQKIEKLETHILQL